MICVFNDLAVCARLPSYYLGVYGRMPKSIPNVKWQVSGVSQESVGDVPVTTKTLLGHVANKTN